MRKPNRVARLQDGGGLAKEVGMPEDSKGASIADNAHSWTISVARVWSCRKKILYGVGRDGLSAPGSSLI